MDFKDQLKNLFPEHQPTVEDTQIEDSSIWMQEEPMICKYERYTGADSDFKQLAKEIKKLLSVGGSFKNEQIIIQGDYRDKIMGFLKNKGFKVKRVGG